MPLDPTALDTTISPGQAGLITDAEAVHAVINELTSTAGADRVGEAGGGTVQDALDAMARRFIPPSSFMIQSGSPSLSRVGVTPVWLMDATTGEVINASVQVPSDWTAFDLYAWGFNFSTGTGDIVIQTFSNPITVGSSATVATSQTAVTHTASTQNTIERILMVSGMTAASVQGLQFRRSGNLAGDTLANDWAFMGYELVRANP